VQQTLDTLAHLFRGFVRERDREDVPTGNVFVGDEISNAMGDDACFTGACAGQNKERTFSREYCFSLLVV
jgi:hypothetical protein